MYIRLAYSAHTQIEPRFKIIMLFDPEAFKPKVRTPNEDSFDSLEF